MGATEANGAAGAMGVVRGAGAVGANGAAGAMGAAGRTEVVGATGVTGLQELPVAVGATGGTARHMAFSSFIYREMWELLKLWEVLPDIWSFHHSFSEGKVHGLLNHAETFRHLPLKNNEAT